MVSKDITIGAETGAHRDLSTQIVRMIQKVNTYKSFVTIANGDRKVNAKSMLGVLALELHPDMDITVTADGADETDALEALYAILA